jgi:protein-tyrosine phosphatase
MTMAPHSPAPTNTYWVEPGSLLAGEYPGTTDKADARMKLQSLLGAGVSAFLDLTEPHELMPYEPVLAVLAREQSLDCVYRRMSIVDMNTPQTPQQMTAIQAQINTWMSERRVVYVHCWGGVGRTGTVVGCHLVETGLSGNTALQRIEQLWKGMSDAKRARHPRSPQTLAQCEYVRGWAKRNEMGD